MLNLSFIDRGKGILATDIIRSVIEQMANDRKIQMVITDKIVDDYIDLDMTEIDINNRESWSHLTEQQQLMIEDKLEFRKSFAEKISNTKLNVMFKVLKQLHGLKMQIPDPESFKDKVKEIERS